MSLSKIQSSHRKKRSTIFAVPALFIMLIFLIFLISKSKNSEKSQELANQKEEAPDVSSVSVPKKETTSKNQKKEQNELLVDINQYLDTISGTYGIYVYELDSGENFGINEKVVFPAASTVKVPLLMALYKNIEEGKISKDIVVTYLESDYEEGTGSIQYAGFGTRWTIAQLAEKMMKESDNAAKNMFFRILGFNNVQNFITSLGVKNVDMSLNNTITPKDAGTLLKLIYENKAANKELSDEMIDLMVKTDFEERLPRYLKNVKVSHKIGTLAGAISDTGIVFLDDKPYTISVYSKGVKSVSEAEEVIGTISKKIYDYEYERSIKKRGFMF